MKFSLPGRRRRRCRGLRKCFFIKSCRRRVCVCLRRRRRRTRPYYDETGSENEVINAEDEVEEFEGTGETVFTTINYFMTLRHFLFIYFSYRSFICFMYIYFPLSIYSYLWVTNHVWNYKTAIATFVGLSAKMTTKFWNFMNENGTASKNTLKT